MDLSTKEDCAKQNGNGIVHEKPCKSTFVTINEALPKELLLMIFSFLDIVTLNKCSQVCKYWKECAFDGSIWKSVDLFNFQRDVTPLVVEKIAERSAGFLRDLRLKGCRNVDNEAMRRFTESCKLIETLDLSGCQNLSNETCRHLGDNCHHLKTLSLESCSNIDGEGLEYIGRCARLVWLDVSWCSINNAGLFAIACGCPQLQRLRAIGCTGISSQGVGFLAENCHDLNLLNLNYCERGITDQALVHLSIGCPELRVLCLSRCAVTDLGLRALAGMLSVTQAANMLGQGPGNRRGDHTGNGHAGDAVPSNLVHNGATPIINLQLVQEAPNSAKRSLASIDPRGCRNLTTLEVARCSNITDLGLAALAKNCRMLEKLDLEECGALTDNTLFNLASNCKRLNTLVLSHCDLITDNGIARLVGGQCGPERLTTLTMDNCPLLTDAALEVLGSSCLRLRKLDLFDCQLITKEGIQNLQSRFPNLVVHAYFAPDTPPGTTTVIRRKYCRCCSLL